MNKTIQDSFQTLSQLLARDFVHYTEETLKIDVSDSHRAFSAGAVRAFRAALMCLEIGRKQAEEGKDITFMQEKEKVEADKDTTLVASVDQAKA